MDDIRKFIKVTQKKLNLSDEEMSKKIGISKNFFNYLKNYEILGDAKQVKKQIKKLILEKRENV